MIHYKYKARNSAGKLIQGEIFGANLSEAKTKLREQGIYVIEIGEIGTGIDFKKIKDSIFKARIKTDDLMVFTGQLEAIYSVGVPLLKGLKFIAEQTENLEFKEVLNKIIADISEGAPLSRSLSRHPLVFDSTYQNLISAGEATGDLKNILMHISEIIETKMDNTNKIKSAIFYPKLVISFLFLVFFISVYLIIPKMQSFYQNMNIELPWITKWMLNLSDVMTSPYTVSLLLALGGGVFYYRKMLIEKYLYVFHVFLLKTPVIGSLILEIEMSNFCTILSILLKSGVQLIESLKIMQGISNNARVSEIIGQAEAGLREGGRLSQALTKQGVFPKILVSFIAVGEESGALESILEKMSIYYKRKVSNSLSIFSKLIEPVLLFVIFGAVLSLALAVFMPMWKMTSAANGPMKH